MREKSSKKRSKRRFLRNLRKYPTYFKSNGWKMSVSLPPTGGRSKKVLNCDFCVTEGPRILKLGRAVIYKIQMISKNIS